MSDDIFTQIGAIIAAKGSSGIQKDDASWLALLQNCQKNTVVSDKKSDIMPPTELQPHITMQTPGKVIRQDVLDPAPAPAAQDAGNISAATLEALCGQVLQCTKCPLCKTKNKYVFGEGNPNARLMFIGEAPGAEEDISGRPFVGKAGQLLDKMISAMQFSREEIYIANITKCRPPFNRNPEPGEAEACLPYLKKQIELIKPECIVLLGAVAARFLLKHEGALAKIRGTWLEYNGIPVLPTFHPSYLLRNESSKRDSWMDLQKVMAKFGKFHKKA